MGIVNITPDSFSDGGVYFDHSAAVAHSEQLINDGADIIDIGGESSRPGATPVTEKEELRRIIPVIRDVRDSNSKILISVDTTKSTVASMALKAGADIVNDISGLSFDAKMIKVIKKYEAPIIIMHMKGNPQNMQLSPNYDNIIQEISLFFDKKIKLLIKKGISKENIIIDPGIGFGKTIKNNFELINRLNDFNVFDLPIMIGTSNKSFIGSSLNLPVNQRFEGTCATTAVGIMNGARIVRVHDVKRIKRVVIITEKIRNVL